MKLFTHGPKHPEVLAPRGEQGSTSHLAALAVAGFQCIWDKGRAQSLERLGCTMALVTPEGAAWPHVRVAYPAPGSNPNSLNPVIYARFAHELDIAVFQQLEGALRLNAPEHSVSVENALRALIKKHADISEEKLDALEAVCRLGTSVQVLAFLEEM